MRRKRSLGIFFILLILSISPVYSVSISDVIAKGSDGVEDVIKEDDTVDFEILVDLEGQQHNSITPEIIGDSGNVVIRGSAESTVEDCSWSDQQNGIVSCRKSLEIETSQANLYHYNVYLSDQPYSSENLYLYLDRYPPSQSSVDLDVFQKNNEIAYEVTATDVASPMASTTCSGLSEYKIYLRTQNEDGFTERELTEGYFTGNCTETATGTLDHPVDEPGLYTFCTKIFDLFKNNVTKCMTTEIDPTEPVSESFEAYTLEGNPAGESLEEGGNDIVFRIVVYDTSDLSADSYITLNGEENISLQKASVIPSQDRIEYVLEAEAFVLPELTSVEAFIEDESGNVLELEKTFDFKVDTEGPELDEIIGSVEVDGDIYASERDQINMTFLESGAGMYEHEAYLTISDAEIFQAKNCSALDSSKWLCIFDITTSALDEGRNAVTASAQTQDDLGNRITSFREKSLIIDKTSPVINSINISGITQIGEIPVVSANSRVKVNLSYTDLSPVKAIFNFSKLLKPDENTLDPSYNIVEVDCFEDSCEATSDVIGAGGVSKDISIKLIDFVGNEKTIYKRIKVLKVDGEPDVWDSSFKASPPSFDRQVSSLINQKSYVEVSFESDADDMVVASVDYEECVSPSELEEDEGGREYIANIEYVAPSDDKLKHYLLFETKVDNFIINKIKMNCRFIITSYDNENLYPEEIENVSVEFGLYNSPVDMPDEEIMEKLEDARDEAMGTWETIGKINKWISYVEKACSIYSEIRSILNAINTVVSILGVLGFSLEKIPFTSALGEGITESSNQICSAEDKSSQASDESILEDLGKICSFVSCQINFCGDTGNIFSTSSEGETRRQSGSGFDLDFLGDNYDNTDEEKSAMDAAGLTAWSDDSLVMQICHICIPGLMKKLMEYRAIKCSYALCLMEMGTSGIFNEQLCDEMRSSMECKFWMGELWNMIPFVHIWDQMLDSIAEAMADPIAAVFGVTDALTGYLCKGMCDMEHGGMTYSLCAFSTYALKYTKAVATLVAIKDSAERWGDWDFNDQACEDMEDLYENLKEQSEDYEDSLGGDDD